MADYIPQTDAEMNVWQGNLIEIVEPNQTLWGITTEDFTALKAKQSVWTLSFAKASNKQNRTAADVLAKDEAGADYKKTIRSFVAQWLSNNAKVTDADRTRMGLTVKTGSRTPTPVPSTSPVGTIDFSVRLQHTIHFYDEASAHSNAKPEGVHACEIFMKADGEAPKDASELTYVGSCTASPYVVTFDGSKAGKTVYYWLRWVNTRGEFGPWSITLSAMVVG
jgi:predicted phage tail protein